MKPIGVSDEKIAEYARSMGMGVMLYGGEPVILGETSSKWMKLLRWACEESLKEERAGVFHGGEIAALAKSPTALCSLACYHDFMAAEADSMMDTPTNYHDERSAELNALANKLQCEYEGHVLFKQGESDVPDNLKDRNGNVVLHMCRRCRKAEGEL